MKTCSRCGTEKPETEFYTRGHGDLLRPECKACHTKGKRRKYSTEARHAAKCRDYGITVEQYNQLFTEQNGCCAICNTHNTSNRMLAIDHCHETGVVRGLLCAPCNTALGSFKDSVGNLRAAIRYLGRVPPFANQ